MVNPRLPRSPQTGGVGSVETSDLVRRQENMIRIGRVTTVDAKRRVARVKVGENETTEIPWTAGRGGGDQTFHSYEPGEQVLVASIGGDLKRAVIIGALYQDRKDDQFGSVYDENKIEESGTRYKDGALIGYNRDTSTHTKKLPDKGKDVITIGQASITTTKDGISLKVGSTEVLIEAGGVTIKGGYLKGIKT